jgi:hypothetical protein
MRSPFVMILALLCASTVHAQDRESSLALGGKLSAQWDERSASILGPLAQANALQSGIAPQPGNGTTVQAELRTRGSNWNAITTLQQQSVNGASAQGQSWVNELVATRDAGSWQYSLGKKIVGWDVGYAFRPNDVVQQEVRRTLVSTTAEGRPVAMVEHFDAESSWSWVAVNPTSERTRLGAAEPAVAARFYQRQGAVDWHAFARAADRTGVSLGAAVAWVASDAVELHASARVLERADSLSFNSSATALSTTNPWQPGVLGNTTQALIGGTWTHQSQLSVLLEGWWDGTALSSDQWTLWKTRNQGLADLASHGAPAAAMAGNLAWQSDAFGASNSLQRSNLYARLSWDMDAWQPSLDLLYHPTDGGLMLTTALLWKGDRVQVQGGVRVNTGPDDALLRQLPTQRQAYLLASWAF